MEAAEMVTYEEIAEMIDHSLLNPFLTDKDIGIIRINLQGKKNE